MSVVIPSVGRSHCAECLERGRTRLQLRHGHKQRCHRTQKENEARAEAARSMSRRKPTSTTPRRIASPAIATSAPQSVPVHAKASTSRSRRGLALIGLVAAIAGVLLLL